MDTVTKEIKTPSARTTAIQTKDTQITDDNEAEFPEILPLIMCRKSTAGTPAPARTRSVIRVDCDVCRIMEDVTSFIYCRQCKQKLCTACVVIHNRLGGTRQHAEYTEICVSTLINLSHNCIYDA